MSPLDMWKPADPDAEWVASLVVFKEACAAAGSAKAAHEALDAWTSAGLVRARAETSVRELDFGPISLTAPNEPSYRRPFINKAEDGNYIIIGPAFWTSKRRLVVEDDLTSWESGIFALVSDAPQFIKRFKGDNNWYGLIGLRSISYGVQFFKEDVERIIQEIRANRRFGRGSRRRKKWSYAPILAKLESEVESGAISRLGRVDDWGVQAEIEREIQIAAADSRGECPPEATVRRKAQGIMELWRMKLAQAE